MNTLFSRFLCHPGRIGAFCPSSPQLCRTIVRGIGVERAAVVAELGPGTGVITREILARLPESGRLVTVELDPALISALKREFPAAIVCCGCASRLPEMLAERSLPAADAVVSGLPWAIFPDELQEKILGGVLTALRPGGWFTTFAYMQGVMLPAGLRFRRRLREHFSQVDTHRMVWRNLPPAFIYRCRKD